MRHHWRSPLRTIPFTPLSNSQSSRLSLLNRTHLTEFHAAGPWQSHSAYRQHRLFRSSSVGRSSVVEFYKRHRRQIVTLLGGSSITAGVWIIGGEAYQRRQLFEDCQQYSQALTDYSFTLEALAPQDRGYLFSDIRQQAIEHHREARESLDAYAQAHAKLEERLRGFDDSWLWRVMDGLATLLSPQTLNDRLRTDLLQQRHRLELMQAFNAAEYQRKRRHYRLATVWTEQIEQSITTLSETEKPSLSLGSYQTDKALLAHTYNLQGKIARGKGDWQGCLAAYDKALALIPKHREVLVSRAALVGDLLWRQITLKEVNLTDRTSEVLQDLTTLLIQNQADVLAWMHLGWVLYWVDRRQLPIDKEIFESDSFNKILSGTVEKNPLSIALYAHNQAVPAYEAQLRSKKIAPTPNVYMERGLALAANGQRAAALKDFNTVLDEFPDYPKAWQLLAWQQAEKAKQLQQQQAPNEDIMAAYRQADRANQWSYILMQYALQYDQAPSAYRSDCDALLKKHFPRLADYRSSVEGKAPEASYQQGLQALSEALVADTPEAVSSCIEQAIRAFSTLGQVDLYAKEGAYGLAFINRHYERTAQGYIPSRYHHQNLAEQLEITTIATPKTLIEMSDRAYRTQRAHPLTSPSVYWERQCSTKDTGYEAFDCAGYQAVVYKHCLTGQLVIAHGGTDLTDIHDLWADWQLFQGEINEQMQLAVRFTKQVLTQYRQVPGLPVLHTGHSLGGAIAAYVVGSSSDLNQARAIAFDSPGVGLQLTHMKKGALPTTTVPPILTVVSRPNVVNTCGEHAGQLLWIQLRPPLDPYQPRALPQEFLTLLSSNLARVAAKRLLHVTDEHLDDFLRIVQRLKTLHHQGWQAALGSRYQAFENTLSIYQDSIAQNLMAHRLSYWLAAFHKDPHEPYGGDKPAIVVRWPAGEAGWIAFEKTLRDYQQVNQQRMTGLDLRTHEINQKRFRDRFEEEVGLEQVSQRTPEWGYRIPLAQFSPDLQRFLLDYASDPTATVLNKEQRAFLDRIDRWVVEGHYDIEQVGKAPHQQTVIHYRGPLSGWEWASYLEQVWFMESDALLPPPQCRETMLSKQGMFASNRSSVMRRQSTSEDAVVLASDDNTVTLTKGIG